MADTLADAGAQLRRLSTQVDRHMPDIGPTEEVGAPRQALFDALTGFLRRLAIDRPIALILDDLHWAQLPTLVMLERVLIGCADVRMLVVATFRSTEPDRSDELTTRLAELHRFDGVRRLDLAGLDTEAIAEFVRRTQQLGSRVGQGVRHRARPSCNEQPIQRLGERRVRHVRVGRRAPDEHRDAVVGERSGHLGRQSGLARPGFTPDEDRLAVAALDAFPGLLERGKLRGAADERAAATCQQFRWERWWHPLGRGISHGIKVTAPIWPVDSQN
ncbi:hypothetical protein A5655_12325 [Mycobacterium sp. 1081908.1]|nr:hypothetical protein A5655_12325 [Mycobacterium sp. 1081908.1]